MFELFAIPSPRIHRPTSRLRYYSFAAKAITMIKKLLPILVLFSLSINQVKGQASTTSVVPLLSCTVTTFSCPGVSGCCTIGGCCGSGCCMNGYTCINEGTSKQTCCPASDPTKCGTVTPVSLLEQTCQLLSPTMKPTLIIMCNIVIGFWTRLRLRRQNMHNNPQLPPGSCPRFSLDLSLRKDVRVIL